MTKSAKKVVMAIVEGTTDKYSLELVLSNLLPKDSKLIVNVVGGDITSNYDVSPKNYKSKIVDIMKAGGKYKYRPSDYKEVIHIVDMDGAYISSDSIFEDSQSNGFRYTENGIFANDLYKVVERNRHKQEIIDCLTRTTKVFISVPYRVFFMSCNLEHVLHNIIDLDDDLKNKYAYEFEDKYGDRPNDFLFFMTKSEFSLNMSYKDSWKFIKTGDNSLKRFTNLDIFLKELDGESERDNV